MASRRDGKDAPSFGEALLAVMTDPKFIKAREREKRGFCFDIGDGTAVCLGDRVRVPSRIGGRRADEYGTVVGLFDEGLGLRFEEAVAGVRNEMFDWEELDGASVFGFERTRKRKFVTPPKTR